MLTNKQIYKLFVNYRIQQKGKLELIQENDIFSIIFGKEDIVLKPSSIYLKPLKIEIPKPPELVYSNLKWVAIFYVINVTTQEKEYHSIISEDANPFSCEDLPMKNNIIYAFPNYDKYKL